MCTRSGYRRSEALDFYVEFLDFVDNVVGGTPTEGGDREGGVLVGIADKGGGVGDEQILAIPSLAVWLRTDVLGLSPILVAPTS